jgi:multidrug efflux pump subunit AcrA (membrane-fusion protein)
VVRAELKRSSRTLQIGETINARIAVGERAHALVVPTEALVPDGEGFKVFVVDAGGMGHARVVMVGGRSDRLSEITEGLKAGERVVTYGAYGMDDSVKVVPSAGPAASAAKRAPDAR